MTPATTLWTLFDRLESGDILIRTAEGDDFSFVRDLACHADTVGPIRDTSDSAREVIEALWKVDAEDLRHFVAELTSLSLPVAYLRLLYPFQGEHCVWLSYLAVDPSRRGEGLGHRILKTVAAAAKDTGVLRRFGTHTNSSNLVATKLYKSLGFECIKEEPWICRDGTSETRLTLVQTLG